MAEENQKPVNLGDLGTASSSDIRKALEGQPSPVEADDSVDPTPPTETSASTPAVAGTDVDEILGGNAFNLSEKEDGTYEFFNPYDSNLDVDLDQFETQRRRVSEDSMLSGILNGVEGLEEGFTYGGIQDTVKRSEEAQGVVNKMKNGLTQLVADTGINVAQGFGSLLYGVPSAIVNGDITKLYDNSLANNLDKGTEFLDEFYKIKRGGDQSTGQKAANFLFDDVAGGASFVMGAIATEMAFTALSAATFGAAAPAQAAATAGLVARGTRLVHKAMQGGKALMSGSLVDDALRASRALGAKATREGASAALQTAAQAARTPMAMQAAARVSRQLITGASMESGMEARHMLNAAVENQKHQYEDLNGKGSFTEEMSGQFREEISGYADGVFGTNMALVGASNMLMFPKLFGVGLRKGMSTAKFIDTSKLSQRARARLAKNMGVVEGKLPRMVDAARGNTMGRIVGRGGQIGRVTAANTKNALYEGFIEEGGQGAISRSTEDYISKRYDPKGVEGTVRFADSFLEGLKGSYTTKDGFKEIGIGMLLAFTGVPMYARNQSTTASSESETAGKPEKKWKWQMMGGYADQRNALIAQDKNMDAIIALSEKHGDVGGILKAEISNMNRQNVLQSEQDVSIQEGRFKEAKDAEAEMIFSHAATKVVTGRYEQSIEEAQQVMDEMTDEELREQLGPDAKNMTGEDLRTHRNKAMESYRARMDRARQAYERAGEVYRGADPDIHTGVAHMLYMVQEKDAREKKIAEEMAGAIEGMNEGQILDFMQATRDLNNRDEVLGELLTLINRRKDIDKQLATKKSRGIIKNIDPKKQEARDAEVAILQESQQENLDAMQRLMDVMSTANNVDRNKYDFSSVDFLEGLALLHQEIQLQQTQGQGIQKADIEQLYADLQAVSADRMELINNYNDFISPGGVQRFEARMIGSIERLADMSPEERKESRQEAAAKEDAEATTPDSSDTPQAPAEETPAAQSSDPTVPGTPPTDDGSGSFEAPPGSDVGPDTAGFGFPDPTPGNVGVPKGVPGNMGLGEQGTVAAPTEVPTTEPAQQPARSGVGEVSFQFTNANNSTESNGKSPLNEKYLAGLKKVISGLPVGTALVASQNPDGKFSITADGVLLAEVKTLPTAIRNLLKTESSVQLVTTSEVGRKFVGGEAVNEIIDGELVSATRKKGQPAVESRVNKVLPNGAQDIKGMNIMPNTHHELLDVAGVDPMGNVQKVTPDARFAGNLLVSTVDSASKQEAWHSVQLDAMGSKRANQIVDLIDAFNQFAVSRDAMTPEQVQLLKTFADAADINLDKPTSEVAKRMRGELRSMLGVPYVSNQRKKLKKSISNPSARRPLLAIEPLGKKQEGIQLMSLHMGEENHSHDKAGNRVSAGSKIAAIHLASHRLNASTQGNVLVADGDGNFEAVEMRDMVDRFGSFSYRMPFVVDGKIYNTQFSTVEVGLEPMVPVPTDPRTDRAEVEAPTADPALFIDLDTLPTDLSNFTLDTDDYLPSSSQDAASTDPMERAGALYEVPGLTSRQLKDGLNFSTGVMARAFSTHLRTKNRYKPVSPDYLRRTVKGYLEAQLAHYKSLKQEGPVVQIVEAHEAYLSDKNFNPLMDLAMVSLLNQAEGSVRLRGKGGLEEALKNIGSSDPSAAELDEASQAERESNPMAAFDENFAFGVDPNSTLRLESKLLLMGLVDKYGVSANSLGLAGQKFINSKDLQSKLSSVLAGVDPSYDKVKERLEEYVATFPQFQSVLDTLSDQYALSSLPPGLKANSTAKEYAKIQKRALSVQDMIRNQFVVFASKESTTFDSATIVKAKAQNDPNGTPAEIKIWNSNSRNMREHVGNDMRSTLIERGFFDLEGKPVKSKFKAAYDQLIKISELPKPDQAKALAAVLKKEFGIAVPVVALTSANLTKTKKGAPVFKGIEKSLNNPKSQAGVFGRFRNALGVLSKKDLPLEDMISDTDGYGKDLINFFVGLADYRENFIQNSSKDGDNKVRYQFSAPKLIHQILRDIKAGAVQDPLSVLLGKRFAQLSQENQRLIGLTYLSGIKQDKGRERNFHAMQVGDNIMAQLAFYGNRNTFTQKNSRGEVVMVSKFLMPTLADKQTMPILQAPAMSAKQAGIVLNESVKDKAWESLKFKDVVPNVKGAYQGTLKDSIDLEVDRIMSIQSGNTEGMTAAQRVAVGFVMMPGLNGLAEAFVEGKISRADFRDKVHSKAVGMFEEAMDADIQHMLRETKGTIWEETTKRDGPKTIGKLNQFNASKGRRNTPSDFVRMHVAPGLDSVNKGGMHKVAFVAYLAKYSMDSLNVRTGIIMDTMGDPGAFVKTDKDTGKIKQAKTATNLGKRFASLIAPGTSIPFVSFNDRNGNPVSNEAVNFLVIPSRIVSKATHYDYLEKIGQSADELSMQEHYDSADAAEYTTVEEHLGILYAQGKISSFELEGILGKIAKGKKLEKAELAWFQPMKPVTTARVGNHMLYVKSASFPLVPQLTQGTELDKLRVFMEGNNVQRAAYDSAVKLGNEWADPNDKQATEDEKMIPVHEGANVVIDEEPLRMRVIRNVNRKYMRIQQEVPTSKTNEKVHGSQVAKLLLVDLIDAKFELNGESLTGRDMHGKYLQARRDEQDARLRLFSERYGLTIDKENNLYHTPESKQKFAERIQEEGISRGYGPNELAHLYFDDKLNAFTTPLEAGPSSERIENLIKSIVFSEVYEPSIEGFSGPIRPEVGLKTLDDKLVDQSDIMWLKKGGKKIFKGNKLKVAKKGQLDQIIMPWKYKASLEKYMDDDGNINADELPPELLKTFAYRIPGQRKSSSAAFEIVGFLPAEYGDTLIVNEELVGRVGQDYDIDKMFGFLYSIEQAEDGIISINRGDDTTKNRLAKARNEQVDIYIASMEAIDIAVERAVHAPVTDGYANSLADQMDQLLHDDAVLGLPMSQSYNSRKANAARSAKKSIGVFAVHNVLHAQLQQSLAASRNGGIEYMPEGFVTILSKPGAEKPTENTNFGDMGIHDTSFILDYKNTPVAGNRSDQFSRLLNHAVDNENNGLLDKLGITEDTWSLWTGLTHMGYNQETIGLLVAMPAVQEYLTAKSRSRRLGDSKELEVGIFIDQYARQLVDSKTGKVDLESMPALDKESMLGMAQGVSELSEKEQSMMNFQALLAVDKLENLRKDVAKVQNHMQLDTKRPKTMVALQVAIAKMEMPNKTESNGNVLPLDEAIGATGATVSGQVSGLVANTAMTLMNLQQNMLPMSDVMQLVKDFQKAELYDSVENSITTLVKGAKSATYALFTEKISGKTSEEIRSEAHDIDTGGIATRLIKARQNKAVANNPFIKQLVAVNAPNTYPHIEFPGDRQLESDPIELQRAFLDLLRSSDPEVKAFAEYLVSYALATSGGRLKARGYLKYVPAEYLQSKGLGDTVNTGAISEVLNNPSKITEIVRHNSELAPRFNKFSEAGIKLIQGVPHQRVGSASFKGHVRVGNKLYAPTEDLPGRDLDGVMVQQLKVVTELGDYLTDEYSTRSQPSDKLPTAKRPKGPSLSESPNMPVQYYDSITDAVPPEMGSFPEGVTGPPANMGLEGPKKKVNDEVVRSDNPNKMPMGIKEFLAISELRNNPFLQELARTQEALSPEDRVTVVVSDDLPGKGKYNAGTNTVTLRRDMINDSRAVTHEMIHAFTSLSIKVVQGQAKISDPKKKAEMEAAVNELKKLFKIVRSPESIAKMGLSFAGQQQAMRGYRAFRSQRDGKTLSAEELLDVEFFKENLDDYYAFVSLEEFVAESFSNKAFAERMSKLSLNRNETFIDRFIAAVNKALMALGVNFGKDTEFLREVYTVSMGIVDIQTGGQIGLIPGQDIPSSDLIDGVAAADVAGQNLRGVDQMQAYKEKRIRQFEELKSRYNGNREFVRRVEARLVQERKDLQALTDDSVEVTPDYMLSVGQRELDFARRTIENVDSTDPQIDMALSALENIYSVVEFYDKSRDILRDPALVDVATALRKEASELKDNYLDKARDILRRDAMQELGKLGVNVNADSFQTLEQTGWLKSRLMDASRQGTTELSFLDKIVRDASQKQRVAFNSRAKRYMDSSKLFKETAYFKKHGWNGMVQLDAKGNPTANMLTMLSGSYEAEYDLKRAELGNTKAFYDWKKSVTGRIDIGAMFDLTGTEVKRKNNPKYLEYLTKTYGKAGAAEFLQQQETMLQEYLDMRTSEFDTLDITLGENAADAKALWDAKNSPIQAYKRAEGKGGRRIKGATGRFLLDIPLRTLKGKATGYYDARFAELQADPEALAFYNDYRQQMKEMMAMLPAHKMTREAHLVRNGLFIPAIAKSLTNDLFKSGGLANMMEQLPDNIRGAFTIDPSYNVNKLIDPVTGRPRQELPTYFLGQVDPESQEYDMDRTFLAFAMMATTYDSKNAIEDKVRMTKSVMGNARMRTNKKGLTETLLNKLGAESPPGYADEASRETTMKTVDTVVDTFYGYQGADVTYAAGRNLWTKEQTEKIDALEENKLAAKTEEEKERIQNEIDEATPQVSVGKGVRGMQQFIQAKGMAWNVPAAVVNMVFGAISVFKHASGQRDFTEADTRKATGIMLNSTWNNMSLNTGLTQNAAALKIQNMMINFDVLKDFTEMRYDVRKFVNQASEAGVNQAARQGFNKLRMYEIQRSSEYFVYGQGTISVLLNEKVDGKSLWEHMNADGVIDIDGYRPGEEKHLALMNKIDQINKRIHGNYDPASPIAIKKTLLGPLLMQFRSWLPEAVASRFEKEKYDPYLQRTVKGTYQTMFFSNAMRKHLGAMLPMLMPSWARTKGMNEMSSEISEVDQENIRKFGASLRQYLQVMILISVLRALKDDEDDKESLMILNAGLNVADRVENDLALFGRPGAFLDMTQGDFLAAIGAASDVEKFGEAVVKTAQGDGMIETGVYAGKSRMWHHFQKLVPHLGSVQRMSNNLDRELGS
jgi:hypothetical protein